jgi:hypothetical protein
MIPRWSNKFRTSTSRAWYLSSLIPDLDDEYLRFSDDYFLLRPYGIDQARRVRYLQDLSQVKAYGEFRDFVTQDRWYGMLGITAILNHAYRHQRFDLVHLETEGSRGGFWGKPSPGENGKGSGVVFGNSVFHVGCPHAKTPDPFPLISRRRLGSDRARRIAAVVRRSFRSTWFHRLASGSGRPVAACLAASGRCVLPRFRGR